MLAFMSPNETLSATSCASCCAELTSLQRNDTGSDRERMRKKKRVRMSEAAYIKNKHFLHDYVTKERENKEIETVD